MMNNFDDKNMEERLVTFVTRTNWALLISLSIAAFVVLEPHFAWGIILGGLIVTINFHLLARTIKRAFLVSGKPSPNVILVKYYLRFTVTGFLIFILVWKQVVDPLGLIAGLSVVVASIFMATFGEVKKLLSKEAV